MGGTESANKNPFQNTNSYYELHILIHSGNTGRFLDNFFKKVTFKLLQKMKQKLSKGRGLSNFLPAAKRLGHRLV